MQRRRHGAAALDDQQRLASTGRDDASDGGDGRLLALQHAAGNAAVALVVQRMMKRRQPSAGEAGGEGTSSKKERKEFAPGAQGTVATLRFLPRDFELEDGQGQAGRVYFDATTIGGEMTLAVGDIPVRWKFKVSVTGNESSITYKREDAPKARYAAPGGVQGRELIRALLAHIGASVTASGGAFCVAGKERSAFAVFAALYTDDASQYKDDKNALCAAIVAASPDEQRTASVLNDTRDWFRVLK